MYRADYCLKHFKLFIVSLTMIWIRPYSDKVCTSATKVDTLKKRVPWYAVLTSNYFVGNQFDSI